MRRFVSAVLPLVVLFAVSCANLEQELGLTEQQLRDPANIPKLEQAIEQGKSSEVRVAAAKELFYHKDKAIGALSRAVEGGRVDDPVLRFTAVRLLARLFDDASPENRERIMDSFRVAGGDESLRVREVAINKLCEVARDRRGPLHEEAVTALADFLADRLKNAVADRSVRVDRWSRFKNTVALRASEITGKTEEERARGLKVRSIRTLAELALAGKDSLRIDMVPMLAAAIDDDDVAVRGQVVDSLGEIAEKSGREVRMMVLPSLTNAYGDKDRAIRRKVVGVMGRASRGGDPEIHRQVIPVLGSAFEDEDVEVRKEAIASFAELCPGVSREVQAGIVRTLAEAYADRDKKIRKAAVSGLEKVAVNVPPEVRFEIMSTLVINLGDDDWEVKTSSVKTLGLLGPSAEKAVYPILEVINTMGKCTYVNKEGRLVKLDNFYFPVEAAKTLEAIGYTGSKFLIKLTDTVRATECGSAELSKALQHLKFKKMSEAIDRSGEGPVAAIAAGKTPGANESVLAGTDSRHRVSPHVKLAVMDLTAKFGVNQAMVSAMSDVLRDEIHMLGKYEVLSKDDLMAIARRQAIRMEAGGLEDTRELIRFGQALGTKYMVYGSISRFGATYVISLRMLDTEGKSAGVRNRFNEKCQCDEQGLLKAISRAALNLVQ